MTPNNYVLFREVIGVIFAMDLLLVAPIFTRYFGPAYWAGSPLDRLWKSAAVGAVWMLALAGLITGTLTLVAAIVLLALYRYFFIDARFKSLARGAGAVGYMPYHTIAFVVLFETALRVAPEHRLLETFFFVYRIDLAAIMICAGTAKWLSGYRRGEGAEYALANPWWGRFAGTVRRLCPRARLFRIQAPLGCFLEVAVGVLLLAPPTQAAGGLLLVIIFSYTGLTLRLVNLPLLMVSLSLLFVPELPFTLFGSCEPQPVWTPASWAVVLLKAAAWGYVCLMIVVKIIQYGNYFGRRTLPEALQRIVDRVGLMVPVFIWRVFTADLVNYFVRIEEVGAGGRRTIADEHTYRLRPWKTLPRRSRWLYAGESIVLSTVFGTLKYFGSGDRFRERLLRYADTLPTRAPEARLRFTFVTIHKGERVFEYLPIRAFVVDRSRRSVDQEDLVADADRYFTETHAPLRAARRLGSYASDA